MNTYGSVLDMDAEALVLALSLLDIEEVEGSRKGKLREDAYLTDEEIAFHIQAENLKASLAELQDRRFALSLDESFVTNTCATFDTSALINQGELELDDDYLVALALEGIDSFSPPESQELWPRILSFVNLFFYFIITHELPSEFGSTTSGNNDITGVVEPDPDEMDDLGGSSSRLPYHVGQPSARDGILSRLDSVHSMTSASYSFVTG